MSAEAPSVKPDACGFYLPKKRRYCKFPPAKGEPFCVQHLPRDKAGQFELRGRRRIPCPLDPNHSIFEYKLKSHLKKCNSKQVDPGDFFRQDINSGPKAESEPDNVSLSEVDLDRLKTLVEKLRVIYDKYIRLEERIEEYDQLKEDLSNPDHQKCLKHRKQEGSLLGNMERSGWLTDGTAYIEFGAGRARLTSYLLEGIATQSKSAVLLIDRDTTRNKCENRYKFLEDGPSLERLRIDIKDLALEEHCIAKDTDKEIVAYSKHLCGAATDLTLRCIERVSGASSKISSEDDSKKLKLNHKRVKGVQIALCCHHRCLWVPYVGGTFWRSQGLTPEDFILTRAVTGWATCAFPDKTKQEGGTGDHVYPGIDEQVVSRFAFWSSDERETIGMMCKRVIDIGREEFLHSIGYQTALVEYVKRETSLENVMLVAFPGS